ncbi:hypothetical protein PYW07_006210 [Mythimna separata]|uniref:Uncharacterized protein n=1 Tax=Mythimna separata TaxID=271217 RepID=A0AAD7YVL3_MYTSE|nr:hypothetical protein PYW07_006210 [Mythimna separata]
MQQDYNVPQPIYLFLKEIGEVKDVTGKTVHLADHTLPVTVVQGMGGYHSQSINAATHNLYEEIPSLGICGDIVMAESSDAATPVANFRVLPQQTKATRALCGNFGPIGTRKEEVRILLNSVGVTPTSFDEVIGGTRLNIHLIQKVSDYFAGSPTFRNEKVKLDALTVEGDAAQLIKSVPTDENVDPRARWTNVVIRPISAVANETSTLGASYLMGYQLAKMPIADSNANWCCVEQASDAHPWAIPPEWINNRNDRRAVPPGMEIERFVSISDSQRNRTNEYRPRPRRVASRVQLIQFELV